MDRTQIKRSGPLNTSLLSAHVRRLQQLVKERSHRLERFVLYCSLPG
jgi:hypothetical protein